MKSINISLFVTIILFLFLSCAGNQSGEIVYYNEDTLRSITEQKEKELLWTRELETVRLLKDISKNEGTTSNLRLSCQAMSLVSFQDFYKPLYPLLPGFSSLDTSGMMPELRDFLTSFCDSLTQWKLKEDAFESEYIFSLALFKYDVENQWENFFNSPFPLIEEKVENPAAEEKTDSENKNDKKEEEEKLFSRYLFGEPFFDEETIEVPVRFYASKGSLDLQLFVSKEKMKLNQIQIQKWNMGKY